MWATHIYMAFMCSCNFEPGKSLDVDHFLKYCPGCSSPLLLADGLNVNVYLYFFTLKEKQDNK